MTYCRRSNRIGNGYGTCTSCRIIAGIRSGSSYGNRTCIFTSERRNIQSNIFRAYRTVVRHFGNDFRNGNARIAGCIQKYFRILTDDCRTDFIGDDYTKDTIRIVAGRVNGGVSHIGRTNREEITRYGIRSGNNTAIIVSEYIRPLYVGAAGIFIRDPGDGCGRAVGKYGCGNIRYRKFGSTGKVITRIIRSGEYNFMYSYIK